MATTHGKRNTRTYQAYVDMRRRCENPGRENYPDYGGRGIKVCDEWKTFEGFYADMGDAPDGMTLERKRVNEGYCKDNCEWATMKAQSLNTRRSRFLVVGGVRMNIVTAAERFGIGKTTIKWRLDNGWSDEDAVKKSTRQKGENDVAPHA